MSRLSGDFNFSLAGRITIKSDINQYNKDNDEGVWLQARGKRPHYSELYWDDVWICDFDSNMSWDMIRYRFLIGFKNAYEDNQISLYAPDEQAIKAEEESRRKAEDIIQAEINKLKTERAEDEAQHFAQEALVEILEEKKKKKLRDRKKINDKQKTLR